jgi:hypothetical protein
MGRSEVNVMREKRENINFFVNKNKVNKNEYEICVWECLFYKVDEDGNELKDDKGNVILFEAPKLDYSANSEFVTEDDLIESDLQVVSNE